MEYRVLGRTGLKVSAIGVGTWQLSGPLELEGRADGFPDVGREQAIQLIQACEDLGINLIDTAEIYGGGEGERRVGEALKGRRDRWVVSTKFGNRQGENGERVNDCSPAAIRASLEASLQRLQTDYIDIYLYHTAPAPDLIEAGKQALEQLKQAGKIRFYGISTDDPEALRQLINQDAVDVAMFSQSLLTYPQAILDQLKANQIGGMVRGAFAAGLLSGKYFRQKPQLQLGEDIRAPWFNSLDTQKYAVYEQFLPAGCSMQVLAVRYLLDFDTTHTIVLGGKSIADYQAVLPALERPPLDTQTQAALQKVRQDLQQRSLKRRILDKLKRVFS